MIIHNPEGFRSIRNRNFLFNDKFMTLKTSPGFNIHGGSQLPSFVFEIFAFLLKSLGHVFVNIDSKWELETLTQNFISFGDATESYENSKFGLRATASAERGDIADR